MVQVAGLPDGADGSWLAAAGSLADGRGRPARDPFRATPVRVAPVRQSSRSAGNPVQCTAIMLVNGKPAALIDGRPVHEGETVGGYQVARIATDGVLLRQGDKHIFLPVAVPNPGGDYHPPVVGPRGE